MHASMINSIVQRQSTRQYTDARIDPEKLKTCIEAARLAPSACNSQPWKFYIVETPEKRNRIANATFNSLVTFNRFALNAPVLVVVTATKGNMRTRIGQTMKKLPYHLIDIGIAAEHFCLQATEEGLGTCMIGWFDEKQIRKELDLPRAEKVTLIIAVGYPKNETLRPKARKSMDEISDWL